MGPYRITRGLVGEKLDPKWTEKESSDPQESNISRFRRLETNIGGNKTIYFPNPEYHRKISIGRRFLHFHYVFGSYTSNERVESSFARNKRLTMKQWYKELRQIKKQSQGLIKYFKSTSKITKKAREHDEILQSIRDFGFDKWSQTSKHFDILKKYCVTARKITGRKPNIALDVNNLAVTNGENGDGQQITLSEATNDPPSIVLNETQDVGVILESNNISVENQEDNIRVSEETKYSSSSIIDEQQMPIPESEHEKNIPEEQFNEKWQRKNWKSALMWENLSIEVNEIACNRRFFEIDKSATGPTYQLILLESLRRSIFVQDWTLTSKCLELLMDDYVRGNSIEGGLSWTIKRRWQWITWNAGFYSMLRFTNGNKEAIKDFTRTYCLLNTNAFLNFYPRRCAIEVCIWLTQEGYFRDAISFLEEVEDIKGKGPYYKVFQNLENPKRSVVDLISNLMKAMFLYAMWRKEIDLVENEDPSGDEEKAKRSGEIATSAFEVLLEIAKDCRAEVTAFLDPLLELLMEYRTPTRAREILRDLVVQHYGNAFIEDAYLKFIEEYFPHDVDEEFIKELRLGKKFNFDCPPSWGQGGDLHQSRLIAVYRERKRKEMQEKKSFKQLPLPTFSL